MKANRSVPFDERRFENTQEGLKNAQNFVGGGKYAS